MTEKGLSLRLISRNGVHITLKTCTSGVIKRALSQKSSTIRSGEVSDSDLKSCTSGVVEGKLIQISRIIPGEVSEWLKEHAWKVCIGQKLIAGSNPALSAKQKPMPRMGHFSFQE